MRIGIYIKELLKVKDIKMLRFRYPFQNFIISPMSLLLLVAIFVYSKNLVTSSLVLESGYTVTTVADFSKPPSNIHPFALLPRHRFNDAIMLDSASSCFYTIPIPITQENGVSHFSGRGIPGFDDGDKMTAMFDKPRSFAIDGKDNVYVGDRLHSAIRKISPSGATTTIAGGYSEKYGHIDGPAQNASFSNDFDLVYVPGICALLISDRGNSLIRQLDLKTEDCIQNTRSGLGSASVSAIAVLSLLIGLVSGFIIRPFLTTREICSNRSIDKTWKHYRMKLQSIVSTTSSDIRRGVANSTISQLIVLFVRLGLSYLIVVFRNIRLEILSKKAPLPPSLIKSDGVNPRISYAQLQDLISFDEIINVYEMNEYSENNNAMESAIGSAKVDDLISTNLLDFSEQSGERVHSALVHRKPMRSRGM